jgi:hypothetical protein
MSYEYEVAISFLAPDEPLARQVAEALAPLRVFVYSKAQEAIAGREGVEAFREVFRHQAQVAVVLFRPRWLVARVDSVSLSLNGSWAQGAAELVVRTFRGCALTPQEQRTQFTPFEPQERSAKRLKLTRAPE